MKKFLFPLLIMALLLSGCGGDSQNIKGMRHGKTLVIGLDDEYAPMGFRDEQGNIVGFDVDLAKETAKRLKVDVEFKAINWDNKEHELTSGNIDIIWNGCDITPERKKYAIFSKPYLDNHQIILVKKGNTQDIRSEGDLAGKRVGTQAGSSSETYVRQNPDYEKSFATFVTYPNFKTAFVALDNDEVDLLICDEIVGRYGIKLSPEKFDVLDVTVGKVCEIGIAFRKDDTELRDKVQKAFDEIVKDGTAKKISEKWFQADLIKFKR